ncbi:MAG: RNB domain-containing ribonuclease [Elusimicrobia bacterium]|nr:RNB domain-containing ribonuclease [Elusimicrobiota bacterium]
MHLPARTYSPLIRAAAAALLLANQARAQTLRAVTPVETSIGSLNLSGAGLSVSGAQTFGGAPAALGLQPLGLSPQLGDGGLSLLALSPSLTAGAPSAALGLSASAPSLDAASPRLGFERRIKSISDAAGEAGKKIGAPSSDGGRAAADEQFRALLGESGPADGAESSQAPSAAAVVERAVAAAVGRFLPGREFSVSARAGDGIDARVSLAGKSKAEFERFIRQEGPAVKANVLASLEGELAALAPGAQSTVVGRRKPVVVDGEKGPEHLYPLQVLSRGSVALKINLIFARGAETASRPAPAASSALPPVRLAPAAQAAPAADRKLPGQATLDLLDRFFTHGPKPWERGLPFLLAEGAKVLPDDLEASWSRRPQQKGPRVEGSERGMLFRRRGMPYVRVTEHGQDGETRSKVVPVPWRLAQGVPSDTVVEIGLVKDEVARVTSIGAYPADMIVGRVSQRGESRALDTLFYDGKVPLSLYASLPIAGGSHAEPGDIVQAFVRPAQGGYEAVPLANLGSEITPAIAAREIALRHGARGYFEKAVILQAEAIGRDHDPARDFAAMQAAGKPVLDLRDKPFITIDPPGASDLDDAFYIEKHADGGFTWYLATADVAHYIKPGTPAFRAAARVGNTFYTIDKNGVPAFPMNHPVVSKYGASLLDGKDSLAVLTRMRFGPDGTFLIDESDTSLGAIHSQGRYSYNQVTALWNGKPDHGIAHVEQVTLARELAKQLDRRDAARGKLKFAFSKYSYRQTDDGSWLTESEREDPVDRESHGLIEELKVYGNQVLARRLGEITRRFGVPHISRVHPMQDEKKNEKLRTQLRELGADWPEGQPLGRYIEEIKKREDLDPETRESIQNLILRTRQSAVYAVVDEEGHEGLALAAGEYDHPSAPIRRFSDMWNIALLDADIKGEDPRAVYHAMLRDLRAMGFADLEEYLLHLNGRQQANKIQQRREIADFMSVLELSKPQHRGKTYEGRVIYVKAGKDGEAEIKLKELPVTIRLRGKDAAELSALDVVSVTIRSVNVPGLAVDALIRKR